MAERFQLGGVSGFLHRPDRASGDALVITHGAGGNCDMALLRTVAAAFADAGWLVLRCDLPFRQKRARGAPHPSGAATDRAGLAEAVAAIGALGPRRIFLGGQSYGGRQSTILASEQPGLVDGLILFSYPLHPPGKPEQLRTAHFEALRTPALFVHGTRDPFGTLEELRGALPKIAAATQLHVVEGAGHDLKGGKFDLAPVLAVVTEGSLFPRQA